MLGRVAARPPIRNSTRKGIMNHIKKIAAGAMVAVVAVLGAAPAAQAEGGTPIPGEQAAASGSDPEGNRPPRQKESAPAAKAPWEVRQLQGAKAWVDALGSGESHEIRDATEKYTAPGSNAHKYGVYMGHAAAAYAAAGEPMRLVVRDIPGGSELCPAQDSKPIDCTQFDRFVFEDGKASNFLLCQRSVEGRLHGADAPIQVEGARVQRLAAFSSPFNPLYVPVLVTAGEKDIALPQAQYITASGERVDATVTGPERIAAGKSSTILLRVVEPFGGAFHLSGSIEAELVIPAAENLGGSVLDSLTAADEGCCSPMLSAPLVGAPLR